MSVTDEIEKLHRLYQDGALTRDEFETAKAELLEPSPRKASSFDQFDLKANQWALLLHLSQLLNGGVFPFAGIIAPIIIWQVKKEDHPVIDRHARHVLNWIISSLIYAVVCIPLCFVGIGFVGLIVIAVLNVVFPIIGGLKANNGTVWRYPLSISFLDVGGDEYYVQGEENPGPRF